MLCVEFAGRPGPCSLAHRVVRAVATCLLALAGASVAVAGEEAYDLRPPGKVGGYRQVRVVVTVEGKLKLHADRKAKDDKPNGDKPNGDKPNGDKPKGEKAKGEKAKGEDVQHLPIKVDADLVYAERALVAPQWAAATLVRSYASAQAQIRLNHSDITSPLRADRRLVAVDSSGAQSVLFSPPGPLQREELELLEAPASKLVVETLLPTQKMKIGQSWTLSEAAVVRLLALDGANQQDLSCTLEAVKDNLATVSLAGKVAGAVGGVSSDVELKGKLNFDLRRRAITWLTLAYRENRAIGHAQPGFEALVTLRLVLAPAQPVAELSDSALAGLPLKATSGQTLIELKSEGGGFQIAHDRRWSIILERSDLTVLRLIDRGDLIAQCNISPRPPLGQNERLTLEEFQGDVQKALGKNFEQIAEASEEAGESGLKILRVVVTGKAGELPIQWTYYHVADGKGRRAALVFTIEESLLKRYPTLDRDLLAGFTFVEGEQPTPAAATASTEPGSVDR